MPIKRKSNGAYQIRVQFNKRQVKRTVWGSRTEAEKIELDIKRELSGGGPAVRESITYGEACIKWADSGAPRSMYSHIRQTLLYLKDIPLSQLPSAAQNMKEIMISQGLSNITINRRLACVRRVLNLAYREWDLLGLPLAEKVSLLSERNTAREMSITPGDIERLLNACSDDTVRDAINLLAHTGLRRGELLAADSGDFKKGVLVVKRSKSGKARAVPVPSFLWSVCERFPLDISEHQLRAGFERARAAIGRPEIRLHDLRHAYATLLIERGVPVSTVRDILGHSSLAMTSRYTRSININIDEVIK